MDIKELLNEGWGRHDKESEALAKDLEDHHALVETTAHVGAFVQLANHTIGEHLGDWPRAKALAEKVMANREDADELAGPYGSLAVAQYLGGDIAGALASEAHSVRLSDAEPVSMVIRTRALVAMGMIGSKRLEDGAKVYDAALQLARAQDKKLGCDRALAITSNNLASELMEKEDRTDAETELMMQAAEASKEFWLKCGTWENAERAEYLFVLIHNKLGEPDKALEHAAAGLEIIKKNGEGLVDEAFFNLGMANAFRQKDDRPHYDESLSRADELAEQFPNQGLKDWFAEERAKVEW